MHFISISTWSHVGSLKSFLGPSAQPCQKYVLLLYGDKDTEMPLPPDVEDVSVAL